MGKGNEECIVCSDGKSEIRMSEIEEMFDGGDTNLKILQKQPKIFIYDCCRGNNMPLIVESHDTRGGHALKNKELFNRNAKCNFIKIYATTEGLPVTERSQKGSHLTASIEKIFLQKNNKNNNNSDINNDKYNTEEIKEEEIETGDRENMRIKSIDYGLNIENTMSLELFKMWQLIKYETEKSSEGYQCVQYVTTQTGSVFLQKYQSPN